MLWIGERTRQLDGAHVEFLRGVGNPLGCKLGPSATADDVLALCRILNPDDIPGRLTLVARMGATRVVDGLPPLLDVVKEAGHPVVWVCDPMHGNTFTADDGRKTRHFDDVLARSPGFLPPTGSLAPIQVAFTWSSPATMSPSVSEGEPRWRRPTSAVATKPCATPG